MRKGIFALAILASSVFGTSFAQARSSSGVMVTANAFMYNVTTQDTPGTKVDSKMSIYDFKVGYLTGSGLYLGGLYTMRNQENGTSEDGKALGASLGYVGAEGFFIKGHYILSAEREEYKEGTGVQADFGYLTSVTSTFMVGVELTYRSIEYKKNDGIPSLDSRKQEELFPMLTVGFVF